MEVKVDMSNWNSPFMRNTAEALLNHNGKKQIVLEIPDIVNEMIEKLKKYVLLKNQEGNQPNNRMKEENIKRPLRNFEKRHVNGFYLKPLRVRNDDEITDFTKHIYKQAMKLFDTLKIRAEEPKMEKEIDNLAKIYDEKFGDFIKKTFHQNIKTRLGRQRVILNTLETSNMILKRLSNHLVGSAGKTSLRNRVSAQTCQDEVNKKIDIEQLHICKKFNICRSDVGFSSYLTDFFNVMLSSSDEKLKTMMDALTEALSNEDFSNIMDKTTAKGFRNGIQTIESFRPFVLKPIISILKNIVLNRNKPIEVVGALDNRVNKTVAFLEMLEELETVLPPDEQNTSEWNENTASLAEWVDGKRTDITEIMQVFVANLKKGTDRFEKTVADNFQQKIRIIQEYP